MRNVIILGSGRSGTSMVAGTLAKSGYYMGENLLPANESNPKGFFEDVEVNGINEAILAKVVPKRSRLLGKWFFRQRPLQRQRWLACVDLDTRIPSSQLTVERIQKITLRTPYCFKDPRFCYTLPVWRPHLNNTVFLCVFRHPATTARSILKECKKDERLHSLSINFDQALVVWTLMYKHILQRHKNEGEWLFLHYDQLFNGEGITQIKKVTGAPVDRYFPESSLRRTYFKCTVSKEIQAVYRQLCELAGYNSSTTID